jgi:hypothetical protein
MFRSIKNKLPISIKFPFWYLFKSPQRQFGIGTIFRDLKGIVWYLIANKIPLKTKPISICIAIKNRNYELLNYVFKSLEKVEHPESIELSIFDFGTTENEPLLKLINTHQKYQIKFHSEIRDFERAYGINKAVEQSTHEFIFVSDVDFEIPVNIVKLVNQYTHLNIVWFPIVFYLFKDKKPIINKMNGEWMIWGGKGIFASKKSIFNAVGKLDEKYKTWGSEDEEFWLRCHAKKMVILRNKAPYLIHRWHPSLNEKYHKLEP